MLMCTNLNMARNSLPPLGTGEFLGLQLAMTCEDQFQFIGRWYISLGLYIQGDQKVMQNLCIGRTGITPNMSVEKLCLNHASD